MRIGSDNHIPLPQLALYSRGDLSFWTRWKVEHHLQTCEECARLSDDFAAMRDSIARKAEELPAAITGAAWRSLAAEMTANIHLGLAAGECVTSKPRPVVRPRMAFAFAGLALIVIVAGIESSVHFPRVPAAPQSAEDSSMRTLEASSDGIAVHSAGHMLSVSAPPGVGLHDLIQTVNTRGDMHSRYTDDTGVTINAVYADAE